MHALHLFGSSISIYTDYSQEENYTSHKTLSQPSLGVFKSFPEGRHVLFCDLCFCQMERVIAQVPFHSKSSTTEWLPPLYAYPTELMWL